MRVIDFDVREHGGHRIAAISASAFLCAMGAASRRFVTVTAVAHAAFDESSYGKNRCGKDAS